MTPPPLSFGPAVDEPPVVVDPRRWGALIGVVGGLVFIFGYAAPLGPVLFLSAAIIGVSLALVALFGLYVRPTSLGAFRRPGRGALSVYVTCVAGELVAIAVGGRVLTEAGHADLRPALIAAVVGLHFLPFAWAFAEPLFRWLGLALLAIGSGGFVAGAAGLSHAAEASAVLSGLVMLALLAMHAHGRAARHGSPA